MLYSTPIGALVMCVVSIPAFLFAGRMISFAIWPVCMVWAAMAARE